MASTRSLLTISVGFVLAHSGWAWADLTYISQTRTVEGSVVETGGPAQQVFAGALGFDVFDASVATDFSTTDGIFSSSASQLSILGGDSMTASGQADVDPPLEMFEPGNWTMSASSVFSVVFDVADWLSYSLFGDIGLGIDFEGTEIGDGGVFLRLSGASGTIFGQGLDLWDADNGGGVASSTFMQSGTLEPGQYSLDISANVVSSPYGGSYLPDPDISGWAGARYSVSFETARGVETAVVPAPSAFLLGTLGLGLVGWFNRRFA